MRKEILAHMFCPYCGFELRTEKSISEDEGSLENAIVRCECNRYPVLEGILVLGASRDTERMVGFLERDEASNGLLWALKGGWLKHRVLGKALQLSVQHKIRWATKLLFAWKRREYSALAKKDQGATFRRLFDKYFGYDYYFPHRFSSPSFLGSIPVIRMFRDLDGLVLEPCCGVGHSTFLISKYIPAERIVGIDKSFTFVYFAKRFFAEQANYVCMDLNSVLPFESAIFSGIFSVDSFQYVLEKKLVSSELLRVLEKGGILALSHLHNAAHFSAGDGHFPIAAESYASLFRELDVRLFPERRLVEGFTTTNALDLGRDPLPTEIRESPDLCLVASRGEDVFRLYSGIVEDYLGRASNLVVNPIFTLRELDDGVELSRIELPEKYKKAYPTLEDYLPKEERIDKATLELIRSGEEVVKDQPRIRELVRKGVLVDVPTRY
jgi:SAM-dependent methyltransferase